ncbi:hypothetical protein [Myceligenerans salitolerans]|uniref:Integral membrane protein n=1 Tax=Myceligenerans salitolerans TaxID=1230528 RepID=A0ABS3I4Z4_9MICO|nr:hypothetical protein [Myceligenerans salitolerans]MBO0608070.1 hypothetical protein [Myceligenerans salitolerans]
MTENTPRDPADRPGPEPEASGPGGPEAHGAAGTPSGTNLPGAPAPRPDGVLPSSGYGAPPPGGYAAEPPGGPGASPPGGHGTPPPYGGGGAAGAGAGGGGAAPVGSFRVGEALGYAWGRFTGNPLLWVLFALLLIVVGLAFNSGNFTSFQSVWNSGSASAEVDTGGSLLGLVGVVLAGILQGLGTNAALREVSGQKPTFASLFRAPNLGMIVVAALLLIAAYFVGSLVCGIGLLVVAVFAVFTYQGVIDRNQNAWEALMASFRLVGRNFGAVFLLELALVGINILGAIPCLLGWLITMPLSYLALAFAYRRLTGGPVMA